MPSDSPFLIPPQPGDPGISARYLQALQALASRNVYGPGVVATSDGWFVVPQPPTSGGGGTTIVPAVMRELNVSTPICTMQEVDYNNDSKLTGEDDFHKHVGATGSIFEVVPLPTFTYAQFNIEGALRDPDDADDPENLSAAILWWVDKSRELPWAWMMLKSIENLENVEPT